MFLVRKKIYFKNLHTNHLIIKNKPSNIHSNPTNIYSTNTSFSINTSHPKILNKIKCNTCITKDTFSSSLLPPSVINPNFNFISTPTVIKPMIESITKNNKSNKITKTMITTTPYYNFSSTYKHVYDFRHNYSFKYYSGKDDGLKNKKDLINIFPHVCIEGSYLYIDHIKVNLKKYPTTLKLIKAFFSNESVMELTRENLLKQVYDEAKCEGISKREECLSSNLIKLISRTRTLIKEALEDSDEYKHIDWLYYDSTNKKWFLYTLQKEYLDIKETKFKNLIFNINTINHYHYINKKI